MKIKTRLSISYAIVLLLMVVLSAVGLYEMRVINGNVESMYHKQLMSVNYIKEARYYIAKVQRAEKNVLLARTLDQKKEHSMHLEEMYSQGIIENLNNFNKMLDSKEQNKVIDLISQINQLKTLQLDIINNSIQGNEEKAMQMSSQSMELSDNIEKIMEELSVYEMDMAGKHYADSMAIYKRAFSFVVTLVIAALIICILLSVFIYRSITGPLNKVIRFSDSISKGDLTNKINLKLKDEIGVIINALNDTGTKLKSILSSIKATSDGVAKCSEQLASTAQDANETSGEIGDTLSHISNNMQEIAGSVKDMNESIKKIAESARGISEYSNEALSHSILLKESASEGEKSVATVVTTMMEIEKTTVEVKSSAKVLDELSKKIGNITAIITSIADQTNMLALNAAIEAARAGEQGKGFSVVAEEVRKLAEESSTSAKQISSMINEVQCKTQDTVDNILITEGKVKTGALVAKDADENIKSIIKNINLMDGKVKAITEMTQNQTKMTDIMAYSVENVADNTEKISTAVQNINNKVEEQVAVVEEIGATSEELLSMTESLDDMINYFKV